jgi:hypothetical protein
MSEHGWHRVPVSDVPDEGRVNSTVLDGRSVALTRCGGRLGALENRCPHQGGPVGEGSIENGWLRCPWHGYDYVGIKHVLLNNNALGKIEKEQVAGDYPVWHTSLTNPDWAAYAELCGATGIRVDRRDQLDDAFRKLFVTPGPALLCVQQDAALL